MDGQGTKRRRNVAENFNRLSRAHERYRQTDRQTDRRQTDGRRHIASSRSLKTQVYRLKTFNCFVASRKMHLIHSSLLQSCFTGSIFACAEWLNTRIPTSMVDGDSIPSDWKKTSYCRFIKGKVAAGEIGRTTGASLFYLFRGCFLHAFFSLSQRPAASYYCAERNQADLLLVD